MAEKKVIEIVVPVDDAVKAIAELQKEIDTLTNKQNELKNSGQKSSEQYAQNTIALKNYREQQRSLITETNNNIKAQNEDISAYQKLNAQYSIAQKKAKDLAAEYGVESEQAKKATEEAFNLGQ